MATDLIGTGLYTPAEAGRLIHVRSQKISRWLKGHKIGDRHYPPLWRPEISLGDERIFLGFKDLMEVRVADAFIDIGVSAIKVRAAIDLAREIIGRDHPLSTNRFRTDGREIFLHVFEEEGDEEDKARLLNLFRRQYEFRSVIEPILTTVDFGADGSPAIWWPAGRKSNIIIDPQRAFGQPIEATSSVPTAVLAKAAEQTGGIAAAAKSYDVTEASVRAAVEFESSMERRLAA